MDRKEALDEVGKCVLKDRNASYGSPEDNFFDIAARWTLYLRRRGLLTQEITKGDVAAMMIDVKLARLGASPDKLDNWIDAAGYAVCGAEVVSKNDNLKETIERLIYEDDENANN